MASEFLIKDAQFLPVCDASFVWSSVGSYPGRLYVNFIKTVLCEHNHATVFIRCLPKIRVLVGFKSSEIHARDGEKKWDEIGLNENQKKDLETFGKTVLGFALFLESEDCEKVRLLEWIESFTPGYNIGAEMIDRIETEAGKCCIPLDIHENKGYWKHYYEKFTSLSELGEWMEEWGFPKEKLVGWENWSDEAEEDYLSDCASEPQTKICKSKKNRINQNI